MSGPAPKFDAAALDAALGHRTPAALSREGRIKLLDEAAAALLDARAPGREASIFLGSALRAWLEGGGRLEHYLRVLKPRSKHTVSKVWAAMHLKSDGTESEERE